MGTLPQLPMALSLVEALDPVGRSLPIAPPPERDPDAVTRRWSLHTLSGGLTEISGPGPSGGLTAAALLVREAQERHEPAAWIAAHDSFFHAPDLHEGGIDLRALPLVRVKGAVAGARAAEHLLRSGAFGFVVLDLGGTGGLPRPASLHSSVQVRLSALCRRHQAALLILARRPAGMPPVASMALLRVEGTTRGTGFDRFTFHLQVLKDKRQGAGWSHEEVCRGPDGLC